MRTIEKIKGKARDAAEKKGHHIKPFLQDPLKDTSRQVFASVCMYCERGVVVDGSDIRGRALTEGCKRDASMLPTKCMECGNEMEGKRRCSYCGPPEGIKG